MIDGKDNKGNQILTLHTHDIYMHLKLIPKINYNEQKNVCIRILIGR